MQIFIAGRDGQARSVGHIRSAMTTHTFEPTRLDRRAARNHRDAVIISAPTRRLHGLHRRRLVGRSRKGFRSASSRMQIERSKPGVRSASRHLFGRRDDGARCGPPTCGKRSLHLTMARNEKSVGSAALKTTTSDGCVCLNVPPKWNWIQWGTRADLHKPIGCIVRLLSSNEMQISSNWFACNRHYFIKPATRKWDQPAGAASSSRAFVNERSLVLTNWR